MSVMASRSSMTAIASSRTRTPEGSIVPASASTPSAKAMSVATGIAHAPPSAEAPHDTASATSAGRTMPPTAANTGSDAARRSASSPTMSSRLSSMPAMKKKIASSASAAQSPSVRSSAARPDRARAPCSRRTGRSRRRRSPTAAQPPWRAAGPCRRWSLGAGTPQGPCAFRNTRLDRLSGAHRDPGYAIAGVQLRSRLLRTQAARGQKLRP